MWAQRLCAPARFERVEVPAPRPGDLGAGQVLLRTLAGAVCGSDAPKFRGHKGLSLAPDGTFLPGRAGFPMHEVVGEVVASRHHGIATGERVVGWATASDAIAEYVVTEGEQLNGYDPAREPWQAVLIQSLACVLYAVDQVAVAGVRCAVVGLGPIGLLFGHVFRHAGAACVVGVDPVDRDAVGDRFGFDSTVAATSGAWSEALADGHRPELVVEAVGHQVSTLRHAIEAVAVGGRVLYFGIPDDDVYPLDMERLMRKNLTLTGGVTRRRREMLARADRYLGDHPDLVDALVSGVYPVTRVQQAFDTACVAAPERLKVVVTMV
jgi:L-iditol 2-dehydrogenase